MTFVVFGNDVVCSYDVVFGSVLHEGQRSSWKYTCLKAFLWSGGPTP